MLKIEQDNASKEYECSKIFIDSTGQFPLSILSSTNSSNSQDLTKDTAYRMTVISDYWPTWCKTRFQNVRPRCLIFRIPSIPYIHTRNEWDILYFRSNGFGKNTSNSYFTTIHNISQATQEDIEALIQYLETSKRPYLFDFMNLSDDIIKDYNLSMCILYGKIGIHKNPMNIWINISKDIRIVLRSTGASGIFCI